MAMVPANLYAPPPVAIPEGYGLPQTGPGGPVPTWSPRGRIGRLRYVAHGIAAYLAFLLVAELAAFTAETLGLGDVAEQVAYVVMVPYLVFIAFKTVQRSHDMDWSGWWSLLALIPLVGLLWLIKPGTEGTNRFGAPPPANGWGVKLLALIVPALFLLGVGAALWMQQP